MSYATISATGAESDAVDHGQGSMGSQPSQAIFLGTLALVLMVVAILTPLIVISAALLYA